MVDASAFAELVLQTPAARHIAPRLEAAEVTLHSPALCDVELASILRRALLGRRLSRPRATSALASYLMLPITRHGHEGLLDRVLELRENFSAYDATYVALAEVLGARLLTADERLARATRRHTPALELA